MLVTISNTSVLICNRFHIKRANNGKITSFREVPLLDALVRKEPPYKKAENFVKKLESLEQSTMKIS